MKILNLLLIVSILALSLAYQYGNEEEEKKLTCKCGWSNMKRIAGGQDAQQHAYPWMVSIQGAMRLHYCGGVIITEWHVLSAAHCTLKKWAYKTVICVGAHRTRDCGKDGKGIYYNIYGIYNHRKYNKTTKKNDITVLATVDKIAFGPDIGPACFPKDLITNQLVEQDVTVMGWENPLHRPDELDVLKELDVTVLPSAKYEEAYANFDPSTWQICHYNSKGDVCVGDSGGPLVWLDSDTNRFTLFGLVSYGDKDCKRFLYPGVSTNVSVYRDWILRQIRSSRSIFVKVKRQGTLCMQI